MRLDRNLYSNTRRDAWVEVNLGNLEHNILEIKKNLKEGVKLLAVIKADAYGHGAVMTAPVLVASGVDMFGVASIDEGIQLRKSNIKLPILVLGAVPVWSFEYAQQNDITVSIFSESHIEACRQCFQKTGGRVKVHIKIDTGMNRIGVKESEAIEFIKKVQNADYIDLRGIFTHFACAEDEQITNKQLMYFKNVISNIDRKNLIVHCANSSAFLSYRDIQFDMVRAGIVLYGLLPDLVERVNVLPQFKPLLSLKGRITNIHQVGEKVGVSYSHTFKTEKETKIATIPIGYADGVSRKLSNKIQGKIGDRIIKQIGNITMDQMMFDITGVEAKEGDIITLLDEELTIDKWASILETINYELTCKLKVRLSRVYTR